MARVQHTSQIVACKGRGNGRREPFLERLPVGLDAVEIESGP